MLDELAGGLAVWASAAPAVIARTEAAMNSVRTLISFDCL
jgi:hypothetical protein